MFVMKSKLFLFVIFLFGFGVFILTQSQSQLKSEEESVAENVELVKVIDDRKSQVINHLAYSVSYNDDWKLPNWVAYELTKGEIPVIYARGNHELKGKYMEEFHDYVGAKGEDFFYKFSFGNVYGLVLDIGEDHDDNYWEYYDTCDFREYRNEQLELVRVKYELLDNNSILKDIFWFEIT